MRPDHENMLITTQNKPLSLIQRLYALNSYYKNKNIIYLRDKMSEKAITYRQLVTESTRIAHALHENGIRSGDLVAIVLRQNEPVIYAFWGAMICSAIPTILPFLSDKLDQKHYFESLKHLVSLSNVRVVITEITLEASLRAHLVGIQSLKAIISVENLQNTSEPDPFPLQITPKPTDTAFLQHSSGSTGLQKGVMLSHQAVMNQMAGYSEAIQLRGDDVIVSWLPLYHDMGLIAGFLLPLLQGLPLVLMSPFQWVRDPKMLLYAIHEHRGTLCWLPNFAYNFLAARVRDEDIGGIDLASMRAFINCSEPIYAESHRLFLEKYRPYGLRENTLTACYAMAENTFAVTQGGITAPLTVDRVDKQTLIEQNVALPATEDTPSQEFVSCGLPIANCNIRITDENRLPLPERHIGEIALMSDSMFDGYYQRPDLSAEVFAEGWYYTGDMGYMAGGELFITGRKKDLIIVGGRNIYPQDIENLLNDIPGLHPGRSVAFGLPNEALGTEDIVIIAEVSTPALLEDSAACGEIIREIRRRVAQHTDVTARVVHLVEPQWLIKTSSGKIARSTNREKFLRESTMSG